MTLASGTRIGPYEVVELLGAGGMREVYRARNSKLNRDVAMKVLPEAFVLDPDRLARSKCEGQVLASLNHPQHCCDLRLRRIKWCAGARPGAHRPSGEISPFTSADVVCKNGRMSLVALRSWPDDVSPDGQRFLLLKDARTPDGQKPAAPEIHLVQHWAEELKAKVPAGK